MTYTITKHIQIEHEEDGWSFDFTADELGKQILPIGYHQKSVLPI